MVTLTVENYLKSIYQVQEEVPDTAVATGEIARRLNVSPGSVTSMVRTLADEGLVHYRAYGGVRLTDAGERLALRILRRHRLIELFLVQTLGLSWDEVHQEAEHLEHAVSDRLVDRIEAFLEFPVRDPHGDPIPSPEGTLPAMTTDDGTTLVECDTDRAFILERVLDQSPEVLRYLGDSGLTVGESGEVVENHPTAGAMTIRTKEGTLTLGHPVAAKMRVRLV